MENKYFTPDIEDFHIGYECELLMNTNVSILNPTSNAPEFKPFIFEKNKIELLIELYDSIRVPYLTKEQIEAEGWKEEQMYLNGTFVMILGELNEGYELMFAEGNSQIVITRVWTLFDDQVKRDNTYKGNCKDINTFRKIIKLLNI
jgi:hypothetical protein